MTNNDFYFVGIKKGETILKEYVKLGMSIEKEYGPSARESYEEGVFTILNSNYSNNKCKVKRKKN